MFAARSRSRDLAREEVVRLTLPRPGTTQAPVIERATPSARAASRAIPDMERALTPRDTASAATAARPTAGTQPAPMTKPESFNALAPSSSAPLLPSRPVGSPWYSAPRVHNPFVRDDQVSPAERDSTLAALGAEVPQLAAERRATQSEVDAKNREALLKMRLTGRTLLVPPDNSGGLTTGSIPLPGLGGRSTGRRRRNLTAKSAADSIAERLRRRVDSVRRAAADSVARRGDGEPQ